MTDDEVQTLLDGSQQTLALVYPPLKVKTMQFIVALADVELPFGAFMGLRTFAQQDSLYAQGRTTPGKKVTNAIGGESWHNFGLAIDLVEDGDTSRAGIQWSWSDNTAYIRMGSLAQKFGLEWGGFWKALVDYPHVQITGGLTLMDANKLYAETGITSVWAEVDRRLAA